MTIFASIGFRLQIRFLLLFVYYCFMPMFGMFKIFWMLFLIFIINSGIFFGMLENVLSEDYLIPSRRFPSLFVL